MSIAPLLVRLVSGPGYPKQSHSGMTLGVSGMASHIARLIVDLYMILPD